MNFVTTDGIRLAYQVDGSENAPTLVFVNSIGSNLSMWDAQVEHLSHALRIVRYDTRGHGASDAPPGSYTLEQLGLDLLALLDELQIEQANICGLSLGGITALWLAIAYPHRIARAVFANTAARIGTTESWDARIEAVRTGGMTAIRDTVLARFLSANFRQQHPETAQEIGNMIESTNPVGYIGACAALRDADLRAKISAIHTPSLIIGSALDESTPLAQSHELHASISYSLIKIFNDVAHLSNVERPDEFSDYVLSFLNGSFTTSPTMNNG